VHRLNHHLVIVFGLGLCGCHSGDQVNPVDPSTLAPTPSGLSIQGLEGPLAIGQSVSLKAAVALSGSTKIVVSNMVWRSSEPNVATVSEIGAVTAVGLGGADISVKAAGLEASVHVSVPLRVSGRVHETSPTAQNPVEGVQVVERGRQVVLATSDYDGTFAFTLEAPRTTLAFNRAGYDSATARVNVFSFESDAPRLDVPLLPSARQVREVFTHDAGQPAATTATFPVPVHHQGVVTVQGRICLYGCSASEGSVLCGRIVDGGGRMIFQVHGSYDFPPFSDDPAMVEVSGEETYLVQVYGCEAGSYDPRPEFTIRSWQMEISRPAI